jgi:hypothetical protein
VLKFYLFAVCRRIPRWIFLKSAEKKVPPKRGTKGQEVVKGALASTCAKKCPVPSQTKRPDTGPRRFSSLREELFYEEHPKQQDQETNDR